jgi:hypothetical protein
METSKVNVALKWRVATTVRRHYLTQHTASLEELNYHTQSHYHGMVLRRVEAGPIRSS